MPHAYGILLSLNYFQYNLFDNKIILNKIKYVHQCKIILSNNKNSNRNHRNNILHILYEASVVVVDRHDHFSVVEQLYFPFKNINAIRYFRDQFPEADLKDETFLNDIVTEKINQYKVKMIYIFGDNQVIRNLHCLKDKNIWVIDIRESNINELKCLNFSEPYLHKNNNKNLSTPPSLPASPVDSVSNLCQLLAKNVVSGYFKNFIYFNLKRKSYFKDKCSYHKDPENFIDFNKCVTELNTINRITLMLLQAAASINKHVSDNPLLVEFVLQCIFLNLSFPRNISWKCQDSNIEIYINHIKVLSMFSDESQKVWCHDEMEWYRAYISDMIKCFPERIKKVYRVNHCKTGLSENLQNLLQYEYMEAIGIDTL